MRFTANRLIYVSEFCKKQYDSLYASRNDVEEGIQFTPIRYKTREEGELNLSQKIKGPLIMICSPRKYKGVEKFMDLAKVFPNKKFKLFLSQPYDFKIDPPRNVEIYVGKTQLRQEIFDASLLFNLSQNPDWIETFGLTIWESLSQGTPVIVPDIGGPVEIVNDSCGKRVDVRNIDLVVKAVNEVFVDSSNYTAFCKEALKQSHYLKGKYPISNPK
jgi:glycosyltransferase involved in cell wall biosynthesis